MNHRERALCALNFQETDRPAIDLGSTPVTGIAAWTYRALRNRLGLPEKHVRVFDTYQMLAEVETDVLDRFGVDFQWGPKMGMEYCPFKFWDGQTMDVPTTFKPTATPEGDLLILDKDSSPVQRMPRGGFYFDEAQGSPDVLNVELPDLRKLDRSTYLSVPDIDEGKLKEERDHYRAVRARTDRAVVATPPFSLPYGYSPRLWHILMLDQTEACYDLVMEQAEILARRARQWLDVAAEYVDVLLLCGYDFGTQRRENVVPGLFRRIMVPGWKLVNDAIHEFPGVKTLIHSCGSVFDIIPDMIEAGVDCLNPIQWSADNMEPRRLKDAYGGKIVFWGGAINTQKTFPQGTPAEVAREAREIMDIFAPGGGFVAAPTHNIQADVPVENIIALYETLSDLQ